MIWWAEVAWADPGDALGPAARALWDEAARREEAGDLAGAALRYRAVLGVEPGFAHAAVALGRVRERQGDLDGAAEAYRAAPYDADAAEALGRLALARDDADEAIAAFTRLRDLRPEAPGLTGRLIARVTASRDPAAAEAAWWTAMDAPDTAFDDDATAAVLAIHDAWRAAGDDDAARRFALSVLARWPDAGASDALAPRVDRARVESEAQALRAARGRRATAAERAQIDDARRALASGDAAGAAVVLRALAAESPDVVEVWRVLADAALAAGQVAEAEAAITTARGLAPLDPSVLEQEGDLLVVAYGGREDAAAVAAWRAALRHRPRDPALLRRIAEHDAPDAACAAWRELAAAAPSDVDAAARAAGCARVRRTDDGAPAAGAVDPTPPGPLWVARVYQREDRVGDALAEVRAGLAVTPADPELRLLEGELLAATGDTGGAEIAYRAALAADPSRAEARVALGDLRAAVGDHADADAQYRLAAEAGSAEARYRLARRAWEDGRPWVARDELDAYFAAASSGPSHDDARALRDQVAQRIAWLQGGAVVGVGLLAGAPLVAWLVRRRRAGLDALTDAVPEAWRDVAAAIGAIRHDVFKHDLGALAAVADDLERGGDLGPWLAGRLYGPDGAIARFDAQCAGLERLARRHGVALDLRGRDPLFGPIIAAIDRLRRVERAVRAGDAGAAPTLRAVYQAVILDGQRRLAERFATLSVLVIDGPRVQGAIDAVGAELGRVAVGVEIRLGDARVRMFPGELRDVLVNLIRNAVEASRAGGRVGVVVDGEMDEVTGLESVVVRIRDDAPRKITTATLRARGVDRGLGLAAERVARAGGAICVEDEPGWSKAVVVRLPRVEGA